MISVDTNVIVRLLTCDDPPQFKRAKSLFEKESIFITTTVILETEWVLRYAYHFEALKIADAFQPSGPLYAAHQDGHLRLLHAQKRRGSKWALYLRRGRTRQDHADGSVFLDCSLHQKTPRAFSRIHGRDA